MPSAVIFTAPEEDEIVLPSILILSTVSAVNVPRLVIFDCAAPVTVAAVVAVAEFPE